MEYFGIMLGMMALSIPILAIVLHYKNESSRAGFSEEDAKQLDELLDTADSMAERIKTLESILDVETPEWRDAHGEA